MFIFDRSREIVGYSFWPYDSIYTPVVGCFRDGRMVAVSPCNLMPQSGPLPGPRHAWWFRMRVDPETRFRLESGDPSVKLLRLEDGAHVPPAFAVEADANPLRRVEELVSHTPATQPVALTGFASFAAAPVTHQLEVAYLDVLGRRTDPGAYDAYLPRMETGFTILQLRDELMLSDEFRNRHVAVSDRVGALITSPMWSELAASEPLGEWRRPLRRIRVSDYDGLDDDAFVRRLQSDCHGQEPHPSDMPWLLEVTRSEGREWLASVMVRDSAQGGTYSDFALS